jgi:hypothetical protein
MIERFFTMTGEIRRPTRVSDGMGGFSTRWLAIMTSRGVLDQLSGGESWKAMKVTEESTHIWICSPFELLIEDPVEQSTYFGTPFSPSPFGDLVPANITTKDRLVVNGVNYDILNVDNPMNMGNHLEIEVRRSESGQV